MADRLEEPYTIASLPKSLGADKGTVVAAPVYGLRDSRKRKRHEVVVGIYGETTNIYNVRTQSLVTSYALSPQSSITAVPLSVYRKRADGFQAQRHTFVPARLGLTTTDAELLCFTEDVQTLESQGYGAKSATKCSIRLCNEVIQNMEILPHQLDAETAGQAFDLLITYMTGRVVCVAGDLSCERWVDAATFVGKTGTDPVIDYAAVIDFDSARKGLLKNREDVLATLSADAAASSIQFLCAISRKVRVGKPGPGRTRTLHMCRIRGWSADIMTDQRPGLNEILSYDLPAISGLQLDLPGHDQYSLHAASGVLHASSLGVLATIDLSGTTPRTISTVSLPAGQSGFHRFLRLSSTGLLIACFANLSVFDTRYEAVLATRRQDYEKKDNGWAGPKLRLVKGSKRNMPYDPVAYFSDLDLAVMVRPGELVAFHCDTSKRRSKRAKISGTTLVDVIGKGTLNAMEDGDLAQEDLRKAADDWQRWKIEVDTCIKVGDMDRLEHFVVHALRKGAEDKQSRPNSASMEHHPGNSKQNYLISKLLRPLPDNSSPAVSRSSGDSTAKTQQAGHMLSAPFTIAFYTTGVFRMLAVSGLLTPSILERVLQRPVKRGDFMNALRDKSPDFAYVLEVLAFDARLEIGEVVQALKLLVQSFDTPVAADFPKTLRPPPTQSYDDVAMINGDEESLDQDLERESHAAELELDIANDTLKNGLEIRSACLRSVLTRLQAFPSKQVTTSLRSILAQQEIVFFIHLLRIELADGGWTSRYVDAGEDNEEEQQALAAVGDLETEVPSDRAITAISNLLNCAVDAIGISGWLVGLGSEAMGTDEMLNCLRIEISAGLEGCLEASALGSSLDEFERCARQAREAQHSRKRKADERSTLDGEGDAMLPIGYRANAPVSRQRDMKDGRKGRKSQRQLGQELSMRVGKYSIDRIRI